MGKASNEVMGPNIEILLWNVFKCKRKGWQEDFNILIQNKDLVLLQEAIINSPFDSAFKNSSQYQWIMARSFKNEKTKVENGVKTGANIEAEASYLLASAHSEPISKTKKMLLATIYPLNINGQSLLVVNSHILNFVTFVKYKAHVDQVFDIINAHDGPILLAGDFNTWNRKRLRYFHRLALSFSLKEIELMRKPRLNHLWKHLDHAFCRGLRILDTQVHTDIHSSDHFPISLSLQTHPTYKGLELEKDE